MSHHNVPQQQQEQQEEEPSAASTAAVVHPMVPVPDAIRIVLRETARVLLASSWQQQQQQQTNTQTIPLAQALHRILAQDVIMPEPGYPPYRASIMDGYAIPLSTSPSSSSSSSQPPTTWTHYVVDKVFAGDNDDDNKDKANNTVSTLPAAYYITTGAMVPESCDVVVPIEDVRVQHDENGTTQIAISTTTAAVSSSNDNNNNNNNNKHNTWIRPVGCDIPAGSVVLRAGDVIDATALGLLAQCGQANVTVRAPVTMGILSTGNELVVADSNDNQNNNNNNNNQNTWNLQTHGAQQGKIPDVNRPVLKALFQDMLPFIVVHDLGTCRDSDAAAMAATLRTALETCQVIVTTGGISMGESDIVQDVLVHALHGTLQFGRLHMKPGKPSTFVTIPHYHNNNNNNGQSTTRLVFALPGNPVSAVVCSHLLVRPCLQLLHDGPDQGSADTHGDSTDEWIRRIVDNATATPPQVWATLTHDITLDAQRPEYHRVQLQQQQQQQRQQQHEGQWMATSTGVQRSSRLASLYNAHALLVLPQATAEKPKAVAGESFPALLLSSTDKNNNNPLIPRRKVWESLHLQSKSTNRSFHVGIVQLDTSNHDDNTNVIVKDNTSVVDRVTKALSGSKSGAIRVTTVRTFVDRADNDLYNFLAQDDESDFHIVIGSNQSGAFARNAATAAYLRKRLDKVADAIAMQVRRGAAAQSPVAATFETVVGFIPSKKQKASADDRDMSLVIFLSGNDLDGGLSNVRGVVKHALEIARGTRHAH